MREKIKTRVLPKKRLKWWFKNNYAYFIIVGGVCLVAALVLIFEENQFEKGKKYSKDMREREKAAYEPLRNK